MHRLTREQHPWPSQGPKICVCKYVKVLLTGGGGFCDGIISWWGISYFKCGRNFPLNSQAALRNKLVSAFSPLGASLRRRRFFNSSMVRNAWPCSSQSGGIVLVPNGATLSAPALGTHCLVLFAAGSLSLPPADMEAEAGAETDIEIDAADELVLEIAGDEEEARSVSEPGGEISAFCALSCSQLAATSACLLPVLLQ